MLLVYIETHQVQKVPLSMFSDTVGVLRFIEAERNFQHTVVKDRCVLLAVCLYS